MPMKNAPAGLTHYQGQVIATRPARNPFVVIPRSTSSCARSRWTAHTDANDCYRVAPPAGDLRPSVMHGNVRSLDIDVDMLEW